MAKKLTKKQQREKLFKATMIAEGAEEPTEEMGYIDAWQHLVNTGVVWELNGFFGRTAMRLISDGILTPVANPEDTEKAND
jgi:hypothetical protein